MADTIPLRDAIRALRVEIMEAAEDASTEAVRFELGPIDLEFQVVAKEEAGDDARLGAKIGFHILSAEATLGASGRSANERTQKVRVVLNPIRIDLTGVRRKLEIGRSEGDAAGQPPKQTLDRP